MARDGLSGGRVHLDYGSNRLVSRLGWAADGLAIGRHPQISASVGDAAGVRRFGVDAADQLAVEIDQARAVGGLFSDPESIRDRLHGIGGAIGRFDQLYFFTPAR